MKRTYLLFGFTLFLLCLTNANESMIASTQAIELWFYTLVPSFIFPYILIRILAPYRPLKRPLSYFNPFFNYLFNIDSTTFEYFIYAVCLGFPSSSAFLNEVSDTSFTSKQYHRFTCIVFMCSPTFILISLQVVYSTVFTYQLLVIQLVSIFIMLLFTRSIPLKLHVKEHDNHLHVILEKSIIQSFTILIYILAYLVIVLVGIHLITLYTPVIVKLPLQILSEFSNGSFIVSSMDISYFIKLILTSLLLSYGGLCVHFQIISMMGTKFNYTIFLRYRMLHMFIVIVLCFLYYR